MTREELKQAALSLPYEPGVYLMKNAAGTVIYVGKAKKLKNRVSQYFQDTAAHNAKTRKMVSNVDHFETIAAATEFEALVLECSLIKHYMPKYNILLKDDKGYPYLRVDLREDYPVITLATRVTDDGARYFGPYGSRGRTQQVIDALRTTFRLPGCSKKFPRDIGRERPCLNHHIGRCDGFCRPDGPGQAEYQARIRQAVRIFSGHYRQLTAELQQEMEQAAEELNFEKAAALRDRIRAISVLGKTQQVIAGVCADTDVWGVYPGQVRCGSAVLHIEDGNLLGREVEVFSAAADQEEADILSAVLSQYYLDRQALPREILVPCELEDMDTFAALLTGRAGHRVILRVPQRGERAELLRMARRNAREEVERITSDAERTGKTLEQLGTLAGLAEAPRRLESYDISHTAGQDMVASMVVFADGRPLKRDYRRFQVKTLDHADDLRAMEEVLERRFRRYLEGDKHFAPLPDLLLMDGGQLQAEAACHVLERLGLTVPVLGMVKDDRHRTRALVTPQGQELGIQQSPPLFALVGRVQEEVHRFAITYHHEKHTKSALTSRLDGIPGVGDVRKKALLKHFKSVRAIEQAELLQLEAVLPKAAARAVYDHFHKEETP